MKRFFVLLSLLLTTPLIAQNFNKAKLDSLFDYLNSQNQVMGNLIISQNGDRVYAKSVGYTDVELRREANRHTLYRIGPASRFFTNVMVMQLIEEGKIGLTDPLSRFYPVIPGADKITVRHLLHQKSGFPDISDHPEFIEWIDKDKSKEELMQLIIKLKPDFAPDAQTKFSNTNYILLGFVLEKAENKDLNTLLRHRILRPLDLERTRLGGKIKPRNNEAISYTFDSEWEKAPETNLNIPRGDGTMVSTASEMTKILHALFANKLLSANSLKSLMAQKDGINHGLSTIEYKDKTAYGIISEIDAFRTHSVYFPKEGTAFSLLTNASQTDVNSLFFNVMDIYFGYDFSLPTVEKTISTNEYVGSYYSDKFPIELDIFLVEGELYAQIKGQPDFKLSPQKKEHHFEAKGVGIEIVFYPEHNGLIFTQYGMEMAFQKKKE